MLSGGLAIAANDKPVSLVVSARKIFIEHGDMVYGLGLSIRRR
jgi:hypothetical protein